MVDLAAALFTHGQPGPDTAVAIAEHAKWTPSEIKDLARTPEDLRGEQALTLARTNAAWAARIAGTCRCEDTVAAVLAGETRVTVWRAAAENRYLAGRALELVCEWLADTADHETATNLFRNASVDVSALIDVAANVSDLAPVRADHHLTASRFTLATARDALAAPTPSWFAATAVGVIFPSSDARGAGTEAEFAEVLVALNNRPDVTHLLSKSGAQLDEVTAPALIEVIVEVLSTPVRFNFSFTAEGLDSVVDVLDVALLARALRHAPYSERAARRVLASEDPKVLACFAAVFTSIRGVQHASPVVVEALVDIVTQLGAETLVQVEVRFSMNTFLEVLEMFALDDEQVLRWLRAGDASATSSWIYGLCPLNLPTPELIVALVAEPGRAAWRVSGEAGSLNAAAVLSYSTKSYLALELHSRDTLGEWWSYVPGVFAVSVFEDVLVTELVASHLGSQLREVGGDSPEMWLFVLELLNDSQSLAAQDVVGMAAAVFAGELDGAQSQARCVTSG